MHPRGIPERRRSGRRWRTALFVAGLCSVVLSVAGGVAYLHIRRGARERAVAAAERLAARLGRELRVGRVDVDVGELTHVTFREVELLDRDRARATVRASAMRLAIDTTEAAMRDPRRALRTVEVSGLELLLRARRGESALSAVERCARAEWQAHRGAERQAPGQALAAGADVRLGSVKLLMEHEDGRTEELLSGTPSWGTGSPSFVEVRGVLLSRYAATVRVSFDIASGEWDVLVLPDEAVELSYGGFWPSATATFGKAALCSGGTLTLHRPRVHLGRAGSIYAERGSFRGVRASDDLSGVLEKVVVVRDGARSFEADRLEVRRTSKGLTARTGGGAATIPLGPDGSAVVRHEEARVVLPHGRREVELVLVKPDVTGLRAFGGLRATAPSVSVQLSLPAASFPPGSSRPVSLPAVSAPSADRIVLAPGASIEWTLDSPLQPVVDAVRGRFDLPVRAAGGGEERGSPAHPREEMATRLPDVALHLADGGIRLLGSDGTELRFEAKKLSVGKDRRIELRGVVLLPGGERISLAYSGEPPSASRRFTGRLGAGPLDIAAWLAARLPGRETGDRVPLYVDAELDLDPRRRTLALRGTASVSGLGFSHPLLSRERVVFPEVVASDLVLTADLDSTDPRARVKVGKLLVGSARLRLDASIPAAGSQQSMDGGYGGSPPRTGIPQDPAASSRRPGGGGFSVDIRLAYGAQPCQNVVDSMPKSLLGKLAALRVGGDLAFSTRLRFDANRPGSTEWELHGDLAGCYPKTLGAELDDQLRAISDETYQAPRKGGSVGPGSLYFVPLDAMPPYLPAAAVLTEDAGFYEHHGFCLSAMRAALRKALRRGRAGAGGSTITQQLVKNLFLDGRRTVARKVQEAVLAWAMERRFSKRTLLELYLNVIEYGPGIFGIGRAAAFYFGKEPARLDPLEAAFLMGLKPQPRWGYSAYQRGAVTPWWRSRLREILDMLARQGHIPPESTDAFAPFDVTFRK